ncbi:hypothetical protein METBIDRAFT_11966 [Metschnikowia bicuspidata var. bicuspidata NRRL YB-4993]|uniref:Uncharacterized protein n=1 Tax=Metschnikowia bicuspidata var. bicuspidata NRRL YB-4993 TaxID=869754 RepID=A0A1A0HC37_9ASCO|nr:hypothetical protein METBIDRAFT_11966 [Metschnikowia bicuspidata var. bicuspidata NRRL YB-4993]OBA21453.1 hypothetical protein METBIDRAFT_11966 [Metschnikowia bicuspidata var. bicuspidata NRRL YB-4993]
MQRGAGATPSPTQPSVSRHTGLSGATLQSINSQVSIQCTRFKAAVSSDPCKLISEPWSGPSSPRNSAILISRTRRRKKGRKQRSIKAPASTEPSASTKIPGRLRNPRPSKQAEKKPASEQAPKSPTIRLEKNSHLQANNDSSTQAGNKTKQKRAEELKT